MTNTHSTAPGPSPHDKVHITSSTEEIVISTDDVVIPEEYQRKYNARWAKEIARDFDPAKFGKPEVARRADGKFAVINGQHRIGALRERWPGTAVTFTADLRNESEGIEDEATAFLAHNADIKKPDTGAVLKALVAANNPDALAFRDILEGIGYRMKSGGGRVRPTEIHPYIFKAIKRVGYFGWQERLERSLRTTASAWGVTQFPLTSPVIIGVSLFLDAYCGLPQFDHGRLDQVLRKTTPAFLEAEGRSYAALSRVGNDKGVRDVIRRQYNSRLAEKNQLPEMA